MLSWSKRALPPDAASAAFTCVPAISSGDAVVSDPASVPVAQLQCHLTPITSSSVLPPAISPINASISAGERSGNAASRAA